MKRHVKTNSPAFRKKSVLKYLPLIVRTVSKRCVGHCSREICGMGLHRLRHAVDKKSKAYRAKNSELKKLFSSKSYLGCLCRTPQLCIQIKPIRPSQEKHLQSLLWEERKRREKGSKKCKWKKNIRKWERDKRKK